MASRVLLFLPQFSRALVSLLLLGWGLVLVVFPLLLVAGLRWAVFFLPLLALRRLVRRGALLWRRWDTLWEELPTLMPLVVLVFLVALRIVVLRLTSR